MITSLFLLLLTSASASAEGPSFKAQVTNFVDIALREAPNDYEPYDGKGTPQSNATAIAPTFATCGALPFDNQDGFPIMMICSSEYMPAAKANELYTAGAAAIAARLPKAAATDIDTQHRSWDSRDQVFHLFVIDPPSRPDLKALVLSSVSYRHLARSPLTASITKGITRGLEELPKGFAGLGSKDGGQYYTETTEDFGPGLPRCQISTVDPDGGLECFTPSYLDSPDAVFAAAKAAISAAVPAGFSASCDPKPYLCHWMGPDKQIVSLASGASISRGSGATLSRAYGVLISIFKDRR